MSQGYNNLDFNNIYRNWIQGQIETANARGSMGGQTPGQIINQDLVRPIDSIINQAKSDMVKPNRGIMVGNQNLIGKGPTSISTPKQLPSVYGPNFQLGQEGNLKLGGPTSASVNKQLPMVIKSGAIAKMPVKGALDPFSSTLMLLDAWFGETNGIKGPGRRVLEQTPWGNFIYGNKGTLTPEMIAGMQSTKDFLNKLGSNNGKPSGGNNNTGSSTGANNGKGNSRIGGQPTAQAQALALAQQLGGNPPITNQQEADVQKANMDAINDYVSKLQEINQPYIESLQRFADNYGDLYNQNQLYNRRMRDLSAITGSPLWYQSAKDFNPLEVEATKIDLQKKIQDAQAGDLNAINEIMGNLAMAQEMGLSPEAAFANKNLLTAMTMRDRNLTNREIAQLNNAAKLQIALQNAQNRLAVQKLRNQGGMTNALIYAGQYGQPAVGLNQQGLPSNVPASYDTMLQAAHNKNNR